LEIIRSVFGNCVRRDELQNSVVDWDVNSVVDWDVNVNNE